MRPSSSTRGTTRGRGPTSYAVGATLYWMVCGKRPRDAMERRRSPQAEVSAEQARRRPLRPGVPARDRLGAAGAARGSTARRGHVPARPVRRAALAACGLQEALAGDDERRARRAGGGRARGLLARALRIAPWRPASWPLVVKMVMALVLRRRAAHEHHRLVQLHATVSTRLPAPSGATSSAWRWPPRAACRSWSRTAAAPPPSSPRARTSPTCWPIPPTATSARCCSRGWPASSAPTPTCTCSR